jgi:sterol desaturase/sphingolipid hydroxylase (fatty acid hydroxylase superfamily)
MRFDYGTIIAIVAALLFYLRLIILQRQRVKRYQASRLASRPDKKKGKGSSQAAPTVSDQLGFRVYSWYMVGAGLLVLIFGALVYGTSWFTPATRQYWWVAIVAGIFILNYSIR